MKRTILSLALLALVAGAPAQAVVPSTMIYQGVLSDGAGNIVPDGPYNLTFRIFDVVVGGAALWTETHVAVSVTLGGYKLILGSVTPLNLSFDKPYWLEVQVGADSPLAPRIELASSPYGLSLRLPFAQTVASASPLISLDHPGVGSDMLIGSTTNSGIFEHFISGGTVPSLTIKDFSGFGSGMTLSDATGSTTILLEPDVAGEGGFLEVRGGPGNTVFIDGNSDGLGNPALTIAGAQSTTFFNTAVSGNSAVLLPGDAVSAPEIIDEAGIAQEKVDGDFAITSLVSMEDVVVLDVTIPEAGYIVLLASAQHRMSGTTSVNLVNFQIDETAGGTVDETHFFSSGFASNSPSGTFWLPVSIQRTYFKGAGTHQFRLEAVKPELAGNSAFWNATLLAFYMPTSYGAVIESVGPLQAVESGDLRRVPVGDNGGAGSAGAARMVNLRELELRVARIQAEVESAQLDLIRAQLKAQNALGAEVSPAGDE